MNNNVLKINNLNFEYTKNRLIYNNFSLSLNKGEIISIVGQSGSGKSTLFELITNNLKAKSGDIKVSTVSSVYQDPYTSFHPTYCILEQIKDVVSDISSLEELCQSLDLDTQLLNKKPHELSGGQLQRCSILRALLSKADLILADEPTSALDNVIALNVMQLLLKHKDKFGMLLITHDEDLALWCSDKIIRLEENK